MTNSFVSKTKPIYIKQTIIASIYEEFNNFFFFLFHEHFPNDDDMINIQSFEECVSWMEGSRGISSNIFRFITKYFTFNNNWHFLSDFLTLLLLIFVHVILLHQLLPLHFINIVYISFTRNFFYCINCISLKTLTVLKDLKYSESSCDIEHSRMHCYR